MNISYVTSDVITSCDVRYVSKYLIFDYNIHDTCNISYAHDVKGMLRYFKSPIYYRPMPGVSIVSVGHPTQSTRNSCNDHHYISTSTRQYRPFSHTVPQDLIASLLHGHSKSAQAAHISGTSVNPSNCTWSKSVSVHQTVHPRTSVYHIRYVLTTTAP
jgi:hypothetical protein